ncbi:MAG TPA: hypothetical protein PKA78_15135 [Macellibacteroides fermentans]|uniref:hypothetical protein n=1 Tax=Macellibacteroides fermentans TaxID=879969 RepID=UPI002C251896|nr:hypothetical protein [Macellibacteroides fermentans]
MAVLIFGGLTDLVSRVLYQGFCLIKLRISNEYIASLTCCKYESVLTKRFRIKQRMNEKEENLESIINHIS